MDACGKVQSFGMIFSSLSVGLSQKNLFPTIAIHF